MGDGQTYLIQIKVEDGNHLPNKVLEMSTPADTESVLSTNGKPMSTETRREEFKHFQKELEIEKQVEFAKLR